MLLIWYRLGLIVYLILILGYECHARLDTNVEKDGYECYLFDISWVWLLIWSGYECHARLDTNVEKDGYECY